MELYKRHNSNSLVWAKLFTGSEESAKECGLVPLTIPVHNKECNYCEYCKHCNRENPHSEISTDEYALPYLDIPVKEGKYIVKYYNSNVLFTMSQNNFKSLYIKME